MKRCFSKHIPIKPRYNGLKENLIGGGEEG